jgi:hypothetical protein
MFRDIPEPDWKIFRELSALALERYCQQVLDEIAAVSADADKSCHARYLEIFKHIKKRDRTMADAFDDLRRSTAYHQLSYLDKLKLLTGPEIEQFSPATQDFLKIVRR